MNEIKLPMAKTKGVLKDARTIQMRQMASITNATNGFAHQCDEWLSPLINEIKTRESFSPMLQATLTIDKTL
jgi:hypothetical protein